ncbi:MAG: HEPN domain-containing protein [Candidatus Aenigmarchaeota archaeon]|nr:HEPN domain-containing protein [Candidatus Aenigmarchaeota archaeon]
MTVSEEWVKKALEDLESAKYNFKGGLWGNAAFFAQQAAEKALKALFIKRFKFLMKIHDLVTLAKKLKCPNYLKVLCNNLNPHYTETRYPTGRKHTQEMAEEAIKNSGKVIEWVKKELRK